MAKKPKFQSVPGMHDILPEDQRYFQKVFRAAEDLANAYGFEKIETPLLESAALYEKSTGATTDIVEKQMFVLKTRGNDLLALRPEFTPGIMRAFLQHGLLNWPQPVKLFSIGPVFRHESPQAGRFRQFNQVNFEIFGETGAAIDAQMIQIFYNLLADLKLKNPVVEINSIGDSACRPYFKKILASYWRSRFNSLCLDCKRRSRENPLRALDCKEEKCAPVKAQAPQIINHLCSDCHKHFKEVLEFLDELQLPYRLNPHLVRGLDYYTRTVFEIFVDQSSTALVGGGRYDNLGKVVGNKDIPACGAAAGVERIVEQLKQAGLKPGHLQIKEVFLAQIGELAKKKSLKLFEDFRREKILLAESFAKDSLKAQLSRANRLGSRFALIIGQKEALDGTIILRDMTQGSQEVVKTEKIVHEIKKRLKK